MSEHSFEDGIGFEELSSTTRDGLAEKIERKLENGASNIEYKGCENGRYHAEASGYGTLDEGTGVEIFESVSQDSLEEEILEYVDSDQIQAVSPAEPYRGQVSAAVFYTEQD